VTPLKPGGLQAPEFPVLIEDVTIDRVSQLKSDTPRLLFPDLKRFDSVTGLKGSTAIGSMQILGVLPISTTSSLVPTRSECRQALARNNGENHLR
jgi:hypothetical protein